MKKKEIYKQFEWKKRLIKMGLKRGHHIYILYWHFRYVHL